MGKKHDINTLKSTYIYGHIDLQNKTTTRQDRKHIQQIQKQKKRDQ